MQNMLTIMYMDPFLIDVVPATNQYRYVLLNRAAIEYYARSTSGIVQTSSEKFIDTRAYRCICNRHRLARLQFTHI